LYGDWCLLWLKDSSVNNGILVAAEEEVGPSQHTLDQTQTLVLMDPDGQGGNLIYEEAASIISEQVSPLSYLANTVL
jgi:hypothetical protein